MTKKINKKINKKNWLLTCMGITALIGSSMILAGNRPGAVTLSAGDAYYHFAAKRKINNVGMPNVAIAYNFDEHWAAEAGVGVINTSTKSTNAIPNKGMHGFLYTADGLYRFSTYKRFEPYVIAGLGVIGLKPNGTEAVDQGNINAGLGTQLFATDSIAFRAEARDVYTLTGGKNDYMLNFSINFLFDTKCPEAQVAEKVS